MLQDKPQLLSLPIAACTDEQIMNLGLGGYRIHSSNGTDIVFILMTKVDVVPQVLHDALQAAYAAVDRVGRATEPGPETVTPVINSNGDSP